MVELMVQLRMSFASVHHFLEGKKGRDNKKMNQKKKRKKKQGPITGAGRRVAVGGKMKGCNDASREKRLERGADGAINCWLKPHTSSISGHYMNLATREDHGILS